MPTFLTKLNLDKYNKKHLGILFLIGLLLVVIAMPTSVEEVAQVISEDEEQVVSANVTGDTDWDYKTLMEEQLITILSQVDGVGNVDVMITLQTTSERLVEKDVYVSETSTEESTIYEETTTGDSPYVYQLIYPTIQGVVVTATGGDNAIVVKDITEAIQALFDVDTHKIKVMKMIED